jgi:hypothetical protein
MTETGIRRPVHSNPNYDPTKGPIVESAAAKPVKPGRVCRSADAERPVNK